jgi:hypothetical protein
MPAFIGPVSQQMRTVASRVFVRLLCGESNVYQPKGAEKELHKKYMVHSDNPNAAKTAARHLDGKSSCFGCHVNLDPLGAALSANFLRWVEVDEGQAMQGAFLLNATQRELSSWGLAQEVRRVKGPFLGKKMQWI